MKLSKLPFKPIARSAFDGAERERQVLGNGAVCRALDTCQRHHLTLVLWQSGECTPYPVDRPASGNRDAERCGRRPASVLMSCGFLQLEEDFLQGLL
ncbi:MAG: hypothetical protein ACJAQ9_002953 [Ilumatobacter sp.]|jgi:hypothetical protein